MAQITVNIESVRENPFTLPAENSIIKIELPTGETMLADVEAIQKTKEEIIMDKWPALVGRSITVTDAAKQYNIVRTTIIRWKEKGYLKVIEGGYKMLLDESHIAYCADIYHRRQAAGVRSGPPLLDDNGLPYELKHPKLSEYRKRKAYEA